MNLKMKVVDKYGFDIAVGEPHEVDFVGEDGRILFSVQLMKDGKSISVRSPQVVKLDSVLFDNKIIVSPRTSGEVIISAPVCE
jgi:hypothetical protein